jgi:hypothetical protein
MTGTNPFLEFNVDPKMVSLRKASPARCACKAAEWKEV